MTTKTKLTTVDKIAKKLVIGDKVLSASGNTLTVTLVLNKSIRTIVLFDGDMEVDFDPYQRLPVILNDSPSRTL